MRSRDGNNYRTLAICSVVLFNSLVLHASEYLISYRYVVKDAVLYNESLQIAKAMTKCEGKPSQSISFINQDDDLKKTINKNSQEFIDFIHKLGLHVNYKSKTSNFINSSTTILTLKTKCFKVEFNDNLARISPLN